MYLAVLPQCTMLSIFIGCPQKDVEFNMINLVHQYLHSELWLKYLLVELAENLRSSEKELKIKHEEKKTFQQQAGIYNELPDKIKKSKNLKSFLNKVKGCFKDKALARVLTNINFYHVDLPLCSYYFFLFAYFVLWIRTIVYLHGAQIYINNNDNNNKIFSEKSRFNHHINANF